jgi:hypothetical protein
MLSPAATPHDHQSEVNWSLGEGPECSARGTHVTSLTS